MAPICTPLMRELIFAAAESGRRERKIAAGPPASASLVKSRRVNVKRSFWSMCRVLVDQNALKRRLAPSRQRCLAPFCGVGHRISLRNAGKLSAGNRVSGAKGGWHLSRKGASHLSAEDDTGSASAEAI